MSKQAAFDKVLFIRVPEKLVKAIERELARLRKERPGTKISRSDIIREALYRRFVGGQR